MGVVVYPRLGDVLTAKDMTVADLKRAIEGRYGMRVSLVTLYELALAPERLHHVNIEAAAAAASVLDVTLDDLFVVEMSPNGANADTNGRILTRAESRRLEELLDRQGRTALSPAEQNELDHLIAMYGERLHERSVRDMAHARGVPVEQVRREAEVAVTEALDWLRAFESDPRNRQAVAELVKQRRAARAE